MGRNNFGHHSNTPPNYRGGDHEFANDHSRKGQTDKAVAAIIMAISGPAHYFST